jgi:hypothetical protein
MKMNDISLRSVFIRTKISPLFAEVVHSAESSDLFCLTVSGDDFFVSESDPLYAPYNQREGCKKSFHLSEYIFISNSKKLFFDVNLFYGASIAHIWYTASSAADFFAPYRDSDGGMLCFYRPDFVIEMKDGCFYIVEITDGRTANDRIVQAKKRYIEKNNISPNGMHLSYVSVPLRLADMPFEDFIRAAP